MVSGNKIDKESPIGRFRNSVGFQFNFFQFSGMSQEDGIDHICTSAQKFLVAPVEAELAEARREIEKLTTQIETCWHCGVVVLVEPVRCQTCPTECDDEDCQEMGCATLKGGNNES